MKKALLFSVITMFFYIGCDEKDPFHEGNYHKPVKKYSGDLAVKWMRLQMSISRATPGFNSNTRIWIFRSFAVRIFSRGNARI